MPRPSLPADLAEIDAMLRRWAVDRIVGAPAGLPGMSTLEKIRLLRDGAVIGQGPIPTPAEFFILDEIVSDAPHEIGALVVVWYRDHTPVQVKADRLGIHRATIYDRWKEALRYVQGAMRTRNVKVVA